MIVLQTIYAGATPLASTLAVEQTGPLQLTVRAGSFTTTGDVAAQIPAQTLVLAADVVFDLTSDPLIEKSYRLDLGMMDATPDVLARSQLAGETLPEAPAEWEGWQRLAGPFTVPAETTALDALAIPVFHVLPGFPPGTLAADWATQTGGAHASG